MWIFILKKTGNNMTDSEKNEQENLRLAFEEVNRWYRHIENFLWGLSSALLFGTGLAIKLALAMGGKDWRILILGVAMIFLWIWFRQFLKDILTKNQYFINRTNYIENLLKIDVIPDAKNGNENLSNEIYSEDIIDNLKNVKCKRFPKVMIYSTYLAWVTWVIFICEFLIKLC